MKKTAKNNSAINLISLLADVQSKCQIWENGSYKTSNTELYSIIASCLDIYEQLLHIDKRDERKELTERVKQLGFKVTEGTPLATKVIRYVFKTDRKRSHTYSRVITYAHKKGIDALKLSKWIEQSGGIEEIRRLATSGISNAQQKENFVSFAEETLSKKKAIFSLQKPTAEFKPESGSIRNFSLAVVRLEADGTCSVVYGINNNSLLKQALAKAGQEFKNRKLKSDSENIKTQNARKRAEAIAVAA